MSKFRFDDVLTVHPTELNFPLELNKENSCSFQLTNKTHRIVAYYFSSPWRRLLVSPGEDTDVGTILPHSTCSVTVTLKLTTEPPLDGTEWIYIWAYVAKDGVKAEDITYKNLYGLTMGIHAYFELPVVFTVPANSSSAVPEEKEKESLLDDDNVSTVPEEKDKGSLLDNDNNVSAVPEEKEKGSLLDDDNNVSAVPEEKDKGSLLDNDNNVSAAPEEKGSLLDDDNNLLSQSINDEVHETTSEEDKGLEFSLRRQSSNEMPSIILFSNYDIKRATDDLSVSSKIGHGGYGTVYKGNIHDTEVAIKILDPGSQQGIEEFHQEMEVLGRTKHPNLVKLIGACLKLRALVYEFLPHGSVEDYLKKNPRLLTWQMRTRIVYDICSALIFLHSIKPEPVVHGDLKPANILLDAKFISKLADFGLCRFLPGGTATVAFLKTKNIKGTEWYIDPDFLETGELTPGCDVYSFGITILRILTGAPAAEVYRKVERAIRKRTLMAIVDSTAGEWPEDVAEFLAHMGLECCGPERGSSKLMEDISTGVKDILAKINT